MTNEQNKLFILAYLKKYNNDFYESANNYLYFELKNKNIKISIGNPLYPTELLISYLDLLTFIFQTI